MQNRFESTTKEWFNFHNMDEEIVLDCVLLIELGSFHFELEINTMVLQGGIGASCRSIESALYSLVCPSLSRALGIELSLVAELVGAIRWSNAGLGELPHTVDHGIGVPPEIRMGWQGSEADLMCLAHEVAHAVQLQLSGGSFMPPIARETCAFLGELALIDWARRDHSALAARLSMVWREENKKYFNDDCRLLKGALTDPTSTYSYRMNYPLARAAAVMLWHAGCDIKRLFSAGAGAMALVPISAIADAAGRARNYLPAFPPSGTAQNTVDAYRAIGVMALLDIDFRKGESERRVGDYYVALLSHLQNRTAFVALDALRRPVGYATWCKAAGDNTVTLTRQAAPFGDHLLLQTALERHLGRDTDVQAHHPRSSRQDQMAW